jgi:hypothetical protein
MISSEDFVKKIALFKFLEMKRERKWMLKRGAGLNVT